jgi:hypothetical protein
VDVDTLLKPTSDTGSHELKRLNQAHLAIIELCLVGYTRQQIAEATGRSPEGVGLIINSPLFQQEFSRRKQQQNRSNDQGTSAVVMQAKQVLEDNALAAAQKRVEIMNTSIDQGLQYRAAKDLLDDVIPKQRDGGSSNGNVILLNEEAIANLRQALVEDSRRSTRAVNSVVVEPSATASPVLSVSQSSEQVPSLAPVGDSEAKDTNAG